MTTTYDAVENFVYVIFCPDGVWVGESHGGLTARRDSAQMRSSIYYARRFGLPWTIVRYLPRNATKRDRLRAEEQVIAGYRKAGIRVLTCTVRDIAEASRRGQIARWAKLTPEQRSEAARHMRLGRRNRQPRSAEHTAKLLASRYGNKDAR